MNKCRSLLNLVVTLLLLSVLPLYHGPPGAAALPQPRPCQYKLCLEVNNSESGPGSLYAALSTVISYNYSLEIRLSSGSFNLSQNDLVTFHGWRDLVLTGVSEDDTVIECDGGVGLVFQNSSNVSILSLTILACGRVFYTTSVNVTIKSKANFIQSKTAVYFTFCSNITLKEVRVKNSKGSGVTIYNTNGSNSFIASDFVSNYLDGGDRYIGGGGVTIETSHCAPGDADCVMEHSVLETKDSSYIFENCSFISNRASSRYSLYNSVYPHARDHMGLGRGGGVSLIFKGRAYRNRVSVDCCYFSTNRAEWGGALLMEFGDTSIENSIKVSNSNFCYNNHRDGNDLDRNNQTVGGAVRITMVSYPPNTEVWPGYVSNVSGNVVVFSKTDFTQNFATWGGAISFVTTRNLPGQTLVNSLLFEGCNFVRNQANTAASAVDITSWKPDIVDSKEPFLQPTLDNCTFSHNSMLFFDTTDYQVGKGAVYINAVPVKFSGTTEFLYNRDTAMAVSGAFVSALDSSTMIFSHNRGRKGGALSFLGGSWLVVHDNTHFLFEYNSVGAYGLGGAVYAVHYGEHDLFYNQNCFFRYHKYDLSPPNWKSRFVFRENFADHEPNAIYTSSTKPCVWHTKEDHWSVDPDKSAFCENSTWIFEGQGRNCTNEITTGPSRIELTKSDLSVVPGWNFSLGARIFNEYGKLIPLVLTASPDEEDGVNKIISVADSSRFIADDLIILYGRENESTLLLLMTLEPRVVASQVRINVLNCPPGFRSVPCDDQDLRSGMTYERSGMTCGCSCLEVQGITCDNKTKEAHLHRYYCMTYSENTRSFFIARCPFNQHPLLNLSNVTASELNHVVCGPLKRTGLLCSQCMDDHGVAVNKYDHPCIPCRNHERYDWALFLFVEFGLLTVVCVLVALFRISIASPYMNSFVFFSQIVSVVFFHSHTFYFGTELIDDKLSYPILYLYGMCNLDFFENIYPGICLHEGLNTLHVLVINYVKALYPMLIIVICYVSIKLYDRNIRILHFLWRPFKTCFRTIYKNKEPKTSIIDSFSTLITLSYTKFMYVSFPLVDLISIQTLNETSMDTVVEMNRYYFDPSAALNHSLNIVYFILGVSVLVVLVVLPPLFLVLYPFRFIQYCIGKLPTRIHITLVTFAETFLGAFRDGTKRGRDCRSFAGFYFLFRIGIFIVYVDRMEMITQYLVVQILTTVGMFILAVFRPYKVDFFNSLDISFFGLLSVLNALSFYNSEYYNIYDELQMSVFWVNYLLMYLPLVYIVTLLVYVTCGKIFRPKHLQYNPIKNGEVLSEGIDDMDRENDFDNDDLSTVDRLVHPNRYKLFNPVVLPSDSSEKDEEPKKASTDRCHLVGGGSHGSYGSVAKEKKCHTEPTLKH